MRHDAQPDPAVRRDFHDRAHPRGARFAAEAQEARAARAAAGEGPRLPARPARSRSVLPRARGCEAAIGALAPSLLARLVLFLPLDALGQLFLAGLAVPALVHFVVDLALEQKLGEFAALRF